MQTRTRAALKDDAETIAAIYNEGIAERSSTFETDPRSAAEVLAWLGSDRQPVLVAAAAGSPAGWARVALYSPRPCYAGVGEASVYVASAHRGRGIGRELAVELVAAAERAGYHKLVGKLFTDNEASRRLVARLGFREVGTHLRHSRLDGHWRDVVLVELLLGDAAAA